MTSKTATLAAPKGGYKQAMFIIGMLFFIFGFVTWLNNVLIPFLRQACELSRLEAFFVTFAFYIAYFIMAIPSSGILRRIGFVKGMSTGLIVMAVGSLIFVPAAQMRAFPLFLLGLFVQGTGLTLLQAASNPYVTILGPIESAAKRISIMGICNKIAGISGILVLGNLLFSDTAELSEKIKGLTGAELELELDLLASRVIVPYLIMAAVLVVLAIWVLKSNLPEINTEDEGAETGGADAYGRKSVFQVPYLMLGVLCIFVYVGVEVLAIDSLTLYGEHNGIAKDVANNFGVFSLLAFLVGYIIGIFAIPKYMSQKTGLIASALLGIVFVSCAVFTHGMVSITFMILLSFAHALMWPGIWPLAINKLGRFTKLGSALMIMGIAGGALIPPIWGAISDATGNLNGAYGIMIPCYLYILYFAVAGHKKGLPA
jgi:MFS transporter, FHS family, L-fucose permease